MSSKYDRRSTHATPCVVHGRVDNFLFESRAAISTSIPTKRLGVLGELVDRAAFKLPFWAVTAAPAVTIVCRIWLR